MWRAIIEYLAETVQPAVALLALALAAVGLAALFGLSWEQLESLLPPR